MFHLGLHTLYVSQKWKKTPLYLLTKVTSFMNSPWSITVATEGRWWPLSMFFVFDETNLKLPCCMKKTFLLIKLMHVRYVYILLLVLLSVLDLPLLNLNSFSEKECWVRDSNCGPPVQTTDALDHLTAVVPFSILFNIKWSSVFRNSALFHNQNPDAS